MKKLLIFLLLAALSTLIACGSATDSSDSTDNTDTAEPDESTDDTTAAVTTPPTPVNESFILNDGEESYEHEGVYPGEQDRMVFSSHWGFSQGYPSRFVGGDEHWTVASRVKSGAATCTVTFFGNAIELYGHTCSAGGMATVVLDGGEETLVDFYSPQRTEALTGKYAGKLEPFFKVEGLENKEHTLVITLSKEVNPKQSGDSEIAVDYALVTRVVGSNPTANLSLPTLDVPFDGYIGNAGEYLYASDYKAVYDGLQNKKTDASLTLFQNDLVNSRIDLLVGAKDLTLTAKASDFVGKKGNRLPKECLQLSFLESVHDHESNKKVFDVLGEGSRLFPAKSCGALWVAFETDETVVPDVYTGEITVSAGELERSFTYQIEVVGLDIGKADASLTCELWTYPYSANRYYSGKTVLEYFGTDHTVSSKLPLRDIYLDDKYMPQLAEQLKLYAKGGGDIITTTVTEDAWNNQTTDPYPSMVKWSKTEDGSWQFDYTDFDKWVALNLANGVDGKIHCYSVAAWNSNIIYKDEATGQNASLSAETGSALWKEVWTAFLTDFMKHVKEKGWFEITYLAMDERSTEEINAVVGLTRSIKDENGKSFKLSMAVNRTTSITYFDYFEDLSISSSQRNKLGTLVADRRAKGLSTTFYTCGATAGSLRNQPYETVDFFYYLYQKGCDGYLRWAFDAFPDEPLKNTNHWRFVAGDQNLIYPDLIGENATVRSSVRYQIMIESYKNLAALETLVAHSEAGKQGVEALTDAFDGYSDNMPLQAEVMEKGTVALAKALLDK